MTGLKILLLIINFIIGYKYIGKDNIISRLWFVAAGFVVLSIIFDIIAKF